jgi:hypothetical protein
MDGGVAIPIGWLLTALLGAGGVISTLAVTVYKIMTDRLAAQDKRLEEQAKIIKALQRDIDRMAGGCGASGCTWAKR